MEEKICPMCPRGCNQNALSCGRGKAYFQAQENPQSAQSNPSLSSESSQASTSHGHHDHGTYHERKGRGHHHLKNQFPQDSLASLLMQCGHHLFHLARKGQEVSADEIVKGLSTSEQEQLKELLNKLIAGWNNQ
ncbi:MAG: hypothetical protein HDR44_04520 [Allobaculum sp.]|nr:hypothetical protein [Allobaculum sp.]